jgi:hypothetical protein
MTVADYRRHIEAVLRRHAITAVWGGRRAGVTAFAERAPRRITCPLIVDDETAATALHEAGHVLSEQCAGPAHYRDPAVTAWSNCLRCETLAWSAAIELVRPLPWSRAMHRQLTRSLTSYRRGTPGWPDARRELDALAREITWFDLTHREALFGTVAKCQAMLDATLGIGDHTMRDVEEFADLRHGGSLPASALMAWRKALVRRWQGEQESPDARVESRLARQRAEFARMTRKD